MMMEFKGCSIRNEEVVRDHNGKLVVEGSGFFIQGNIYVSVLSKDGKPYGGLIGNNFPNKDTFSADEIGVSYFSKEGLLDYMYDLEFLKKYVKEKELVKKPL